MRLPSEHRQAAVAPMLQTDRLENSAKPLRAIEFGRHYEQTQHFAIKDAGRAGIPSF
jgi:hypothetical protein